MSRHWDRADVALHILDMGGQAIDTSTAIGRMFLTMTAGFAEFERNQTSERTITAMEHKKQHLQAYSPTPFGFERSGPAHEKSGLPAELSRHSHEAEVVQMMKRWDAERWTYQAIRGRADEEMRTDEARRKALVCLDRSRDPAQRSSQIKSRARRCFMHGRNDAGPRRVAVPACG